MQASQRKTKTQVSRDVYNKTQNVMVQPPQTHNQINTWQ